MPSIPSRFPAVVTDYVLVFISEMGDMTLHLEMAFAHRLDADRLARALELAYDAEPILGCRFVVHPWRPYWERIDFRAAQNFVLVENEAEYEAFRLTPVDPPKGPQVTACLWRKPEEDRLLLKISHQVSDAGGCKHVAAIISEIYNRLADNPRYIPEPNLTGRRNAWQILGRLPWHAFPRIYWNFLKETWSSTHPPKTLTLPATSERGPTAAYVVRHLSAERVARIAEFGRARQATINDQVSAAFLRALTTLAPWDGSLGLRINHSIDLRRRYLPDGKAEAVCNLSALEPINLRTDPGVDFEATLDRVVAQTSVRKANYFGLNGYVAVMPTVWLMPFCMSRWIFHRFLRWFATTHVVPNAMTNLGPVPPECVTFGSPPTSAWLLCPPIFPPYFGFGISGYAGSLTFSAATYPPGMAVEQIESVFKTIFQVLPE